PFGLAAMLATPIDLGAAGTTHSSLGSPFPDCVNVIDKVTETNPGRRGCDEALTLGDGCAAGDFLFQINPGDIKTTRHCTAPEDCCSLPSGGTTHTGECPHAAATFASYTCTYTWDVSMAYQPDPSSVPISAAMTTSSTGTTLTPTDMSLGNVSFTFDLTDRSVT